MRMIAATFFCVWILQAEGDQKAIQGTWTVAEYDQNGHRIHTDILATMSVAIKGDRITISPKLSVQYKSVIQNGKNETEAAFSTDSGKSDEAMSGLNQKKAGSIYPGKEPKGNRRPSKRPYLSGRRVLENLFCTYPTRSDPRKLPELPKAGAGENGPYTTCQVSREESFDPSLTGPFHADQVPERRQDELASGYCDLAS